MSEHDISGTWEFNSSKSQLHIPAPDKSVFQIELDEENFHLTRTHTIGDIKDTFSIDVSTDGSEVVGIIGEAEMRARLYWEDETLVLDSTIILEGEQASNIVKYHLEDIGNTLVAEEHFGSDQHKHVNRWVFDRVKQES